MLERQLYRTQKELLVGVDEAGRGSLAGPLAVAAAAFPKKLFCQKELPHELSHIQDSKQLKANQREHFYPLIKRSALFAQTVFLSNRFIDELNVNRATERAIIYLVHRLKKNGFLRVRLLVDGNYALSLVKQNFPDLVCDSIIKGDQKVFSISAASILAKVSRDKRMDRLAKIFPYYSWETNKGYPTRYHRKQIQSLGLTGLHRRTYCN